MADSRFALMLIIVICSPIIHAQSIPQGYQTIAIRWAVPAEMLYTVALVESGTHLPQGQRPWPWTLNVAGKSYRYATKQEACGALNRFVHNVNLKQIDVGLGQINLGWHRQYFSNYCEALSPYKNLHVTAYILRQQYNEKPGSWLHAAARYHRPAGGEPARRYRKKIMSQLNLLTTDTARHPADQK
jgi:hypothetical protein